MANLMKSSEFERGKEGRDLSLALRDEAQQLLEAACQSQVIDHMIAEAAIVSLLEILNSASFICFYRY